MCTRGYLANDREKGSRDELKAELVYGFGRTHTSTLFHWRLPHHLSSDECSPDLLAIPYHGSWPSQRVRDSACPANCRSYSSQTNDPFSTARMRGKDEGWYKAGLLNAAGIGVLQQPARYCGVGRADESEVWISANEEEGDHETSWKRKSCDASAAREPRHNTTTTSSRPRD